MDDWQKQADDEAAAAAERIARQNNLLADDVFNSPFSLSKDVGKAPEVSGTDAMVAEREKFGKQLSQHRADSVSQGAGNPYVKAAEPAFDAFDTVAAPLMYGAKKLLDGRRDDWSDEQALGAQISKPIDNIVSGAKNIGHGVNEVVGFLAGKPEWSPVPQPKVRQEDTLTGKHIAEATKEFAEQTRPDAKDSDDWKFLGRTATRAASAVLSAPRSAVNAINKGAASAERGAGSLLGHMMGLGDDVATGGSTIGVRRGAVPSPFSAKPPVAANSLTEGEKNALIMSILDDSEKVAAQMGKRLDETTQELIAGAILKKATEGATAEGGPMLAMMMGTPRKERMSMFRSWAGDFLESSGRSASSVERPVSIDAPLPSGKGTVAGTIPEREPVLDAMMGRKPDRTYDVLDELGVQHEAPQRVQGEIVGAPADVGRARRAPKNEAPELGQERANRVVSMVEEIRGMGEATPDAVTPVMETFGKLNRESAIAVVEELGGRAGRTKESAVAEFSRIIADIGKEPLLDNTPPTTARGRQIAEEVATVQRGEQKLQSLKHSPDFEIVEPTAKAADDIPDWLDDLSGLEEGWTPGKAAAAAPPPPNPSKPGRVTMDQAGDGDLIEALQGGGWTIGVGKNKKRGGEYDGYGELFKSLPPNIRQKLFSSNPNASPPDEVAAAMYNRGLIEDAYPDTLWRAIEQAVENRRGVQASMQEEQKLVRQFESFEKMAGAPTKGADVVRGGDLKPGDSFTLRGQEFNVLGGTEAEQAAAAARRTPGPDQVVVDDGPRFGTQVLDADKTYNFKNYKPAITPEGPTPTQTTAPFKTPAGSSPGGGASPPPTNAPVGGGSIPSDPTQPPPDGGSLFPPPLQLPAVIPPKRPHPFAGPLVPVDEWKPKPFAKTTYSDHRPGRAAATVMDAQKRKSSDSLIARIPVLNKLLQHGWYDRLTTHGRAVLKKNGYLANDEGINRALDIRNSAQQEAAALMPELDDAVTGLFKGGKLGPSTPMKALLEERAWSQGGHNALGQRAAGNQQLHNDFTVTDYTLAMDSYAREGAGLGRGPYRIADADADRFVGASKKAFQKAGQVAEREGVWVETPEGMQRFKYDNERERARQVLNGDLTFLGKENDPLYEKLVEGITTRPANIKKGVTADWFRGFVKKAMEMNRFDRQEAFEKIRQVLEIPDFMYDTAASGDRVRYVINSGLFDVIPNGSNKGAHLSSRFLNEMTRAHAVGNWGTYGAIDPRVPNYVPKLLERIIAESGPRAGESFKRVIAGLHGNSNMAGYTPSMEVDATNVFVRAYHAMVNAQRRLDVAKTSALSAAQPFQEGPALAFGKAGPAKAFADLVVRQPKSIFAEGLRFLGFEGLASKVTPNVRRQSHSVAIPLSDIREGTLPVVNELTASEGWRAFKDQSMRFHDEAPQMEHRFRTTNPIEYTLTLTDRANARMAAANDGTMIGLGSERMASDLVDLAESGKLSKNDELILKDLDVSGETIAALKRQAGKPATAAFEEAVKREIANRVTIKTQMRTMDSLDTQRMLNTPWIKPWVAFWRYGLNTVRETENFVRKGISIAGDAKLGRWEKAGELADLTQRLAFRLGGAAIQGEIRNQIYRAMGREPTDLEEESVFGRIVMDILYANVIGPYAILTDLAAQEAGIPRPWATRDGKESKAQNLSTLVYPLDKGQKVLGAAAESAGIAGEKLGMWERKNPDDQGVLDPIIRHVMEQQAPQVLGRMVAGNEAVEEIVHPEKPKGSARDRVMEGLTEKRGSSRDRVMKDLMSDRPVKSSSRERVLRDLLSN